MKTLVGHTPPVPDPSPAQTRGRNVYRKNIDAACDITFVAVGKCGHTRSSELPQLHIREKSTVLPVVEHPLFKGIKKGVIIVRRCIHLTAFVSFMPGIGKVLKIGLLFCWR